MSFTPRQRQVLLLVAEGLTIKQIADQLGISEGCAKDHFDLAKDKIPIAKGNRNRVVIANWIHKNLSKAGERSGKTKSKHSRVFA